MWSLPGRPGENIKAVAEPGIELSRVEQISSKFFWGKKSHVINKKMVQTNSFVTFHRVEVQTD
jgi:hypothetical protein